MRWPWVSREVLQQAELRIALMEQQCQDWRTLVVAANDRAHTATDRYHAVVERMVELKRAGFEKPDRIAPLERRVEPDPVLQAIIAKSGNSPILRAHYFRYVGEQRSLGMPDDAIAAAILAGQPDGEDGIPG